MQSLMGGADCGASSNPLKQVAQREGVDNSLFKDRLAPTAGPSGPSQSAFRPNFPQAHLQPPNANAIHVNPTPHPFNLSHLSAALSQTQAQPAPASQADPRAFDRQWNHAVNNAISSQQPRILPAPVHQQQQQQQRSGGQSAWSSDFQSYSNVSGKGKGRAVELPTAQTYQPQSGYYPTQLGNGYKSQMYPYQPVLGNHQGFGGSALQGHLNQQPQTQGQMSHQDMDNLFARAEEDWKAGSTANELAAEEQKEGEGETAQRVEEDGVREMTDDPKGDFEAVWESLKPEAERLGKLAEWERDFSQFTHDEDDLFDILNESLNRPDVGQSDLDQQLGLNMGGGISMPTGFEEDGTYRVGNAETDAHSNVSLAALWTEANELLLSGGSLSTAASMIESFLQRSTAQDRSELGVSATQAWSLLGRVHAMDEKEEKAMRAFQEGRKALEEEGVTDKAAIAGEMLTNLAISYVNESLDLAALTVLHQFLRTIHPSFAGQDPSKQAMGIEDTTSPWAVHQGVTDSFLSLAREQYQSGGQVDPDVQVGLGTLYYMMGEYERARECWVAALNERPDDYLLWNRLGATLANGGSSEEAVDAYRRALELKPMFTRAIFNLGVACLNIGVYKEAAEHFLAALSLHPAQASVGSVNGDSTDVQLYDSGSLWSTLRRALVALDMPQLAEQSKPGTDLGVFRNAGFDF
ncbi:hypothetical protein I316_05124 [Kwoniella heveanensis BCC8398]|uniref:Peroxin-5 n=1 Tax=Kwoniella heveanensis BCC8398 TaxID=1296120 RepID=A0A1B9GPQ7_9TREE|nr:hypothetical protein I316_05124 [Kwoniella heveanensis BCC8398]